MGSCDRLVPEHIGPVVAVRLLLRRGPDIFLGQRMSQNGAWPGSNSVRFIQQQQRGRMVISLQS